MQITITKEDLIHARSEGTVIVFTGTDENGDRVTFGADHRPAEALYEAALESGDPVTADVDEWQVTGRIPLRKGRMRRSPIGGPTGEVASSYLPANYKVTEVTPEWVFFEGHDWAGWTLEDYVIPRLASGLIWAEEVTEVTP
jgi:hypothetical protein